MTHLTHATTAIKAKDIKRNWHLIDAGGHVLGRVASKAARLLIGKHKVNYEPHLDMGDNVVIVNCSEVVITGRKNEQKIYTRYSGYPGGLKNISYQKMKEERPYEIIRRAVMGMLPKNKLRDRRITRLYIYQDEKHPYTDKFINKE